MALTGVGTVMVMWRRRGGSGSGRRGKGRMAAMEEAPQVALETSMGRIVLEMYVNHAPKTTKNFMELARRYVLKWIMDFKIKRNEMS